MTRRRGRCAGTWLALCTAALVATGPASAQTLPPDGGDPTRPPATLDPSARDPSARKAPPPTDEPETPYDEASWRALTEGKTLTYMTPYGPMGREYYRPGGNEVVFIYFDNQCFDGTWSYAAGLFCFQYDGEHCFEHFKRGEDIIAREMDGDEQVVVEFSDEVLSCKPSLTSEAPAAEPRT